MDKRDLNFQLNYNKDWIHWLQTGQHYEPEVLEAMLRFVQPGDKVIDAGANLGLFSLALSQMVEAQGEVIAFEPDDKLFDQLVKNIELNKVQNVLCFKQALWETMLGLEFYSVPHGGYSSFIEMVNEDTTVQKVLALPLDCLIDPACPIRLLKIDCEGAEFNILRGAKELLTRGVDCVLVEFSFYLMNVMSITEKDIRDFMHSLGYDFFFLHKNGARPLYVENEKRIEIKNNTQIVNVLFSTREKVARAWT